MAFILLADANIVGVVDDLVRAMRSAEWHEFWDYLNLSVTYFADVGLASNDDDALIWQICQERQLILLTDNRNSRGENSLEATMRRHGSASSLPVFTIASVSRLQKDGNYAQRVIDAIYQKLLYFDDFRGTGRIYVP